MRLTSFLPAAAVAVLAAAAAPLAAQQPALPTQAITIQPLSAIFTVFAGEYERRAGQNFTFGIGATHWGDDADDGSDASYTSGDIKLRFYPQGVPLRGFAIGLSGGFTSVSGTNSVGVSESASGPTFGTFLDYQWLMGAKSNVIVALGIGAKMLMIDEDAIESATLRYPTGRISIGFAF